jgi:hypothetical protein
MVEQNITCQIKTAQVSSKINEILQTLLGMPCRDDSQFSRINGPYTDEST